MQLELAEARKANRALREQVGHLTREAEGKARGKAVTAASGAPRATGAASHAAATIAELQRQLDATTEQLELMRAANAELAADRAELTTLLRSAPSQQQLQRPTRLSSSSGECAAGWEAGRGSGVVTAG